MGGRKRGAGGLLRMKAWQLVAAAIYALAAICVMAALGQVAGGASEKPPGADSSDLNPLAVKFKLTELVKDAIPMLVNVLQAWQTHSCVGVLLSPTVVMAPASCASSAGSVSLVRANSNQVQGDGPEDEQEVLPACKRIIHPDFTGTPEEGNDIALIFLGVHASIPEDRLPNLVSVAECSSGEMLMYGWFAPRKNDGPSSDLERLPGMKHAPEVCNLHFSELSPAPICMKTVATTQVAWDLGALLTCNTTDVIGLMTGTVPDKATSHDHVTYVYTSVQAHHDWIKRTLDPKCGCNDQSVVFVNWQDERCEPFVKGGSDGPGSCKKNDDGHGWCQVDIDGAGSCNYVPDGTGPAK